MIYDELKSQNMYERIYLNVEKGAFTNDAIIRKEVDAALKIIIEQIEETKETLKLNYNKISYELSTEEVKIKKYKIILGNIKHDGYIGENYKELFVNLMHKYGASDVEIVEMFERIYINYQDKKNNEINHKMYNVINMLNAEYQPYVITELENYEYKATLTPLINSIYDTLMQNGVEYIISYLTTSLPNNLTLEEYDYTFKNVINKIIANLEESLADIKNIELYTELRNVIIKEYNNRLQSFKILRAFYYKERQKYEYINESKSELDSSEDVNKIIYLPNVSSTYLERDFKDIPQEFYPDIVKLLDNLKKGQLNKKNFKPFKNNNKLKTFTELRDDQLRILTKNVKENIYIILGMFQKQDDNDVKAFISLASRFNQSGYTNEKDLECLLESSKEDNIRIYDYLNEKSRKGNR